LSKFSCFVFGNPNSKTVPGTAYIWGLLIANHLDQSLWSTNQKYWAAVRSNLLYSLLEVQNCVASFTSHGKLHEFDAEKPISWAKPAHFDFFAISYTVWSHIQSVVRGALRGFYWGQKASIFQFRTMHAEFGAKDAQTRPAGTGS
jgi:hypothetical protein